MPANQGTAPVQAPAAMSWIYLKDMVAWLKNPNIPMWIRRDHKANNEGGVDLTAPPGTPVYALATGPLLSADSFADVGQAHPGSVLAQRVNVPGYGPQDIYYQHIDLLPGMQRCLGGNCGGRIVYAGQQIGTVGYVGETEIGFNPQGWGSLYGPDTHPGPWPDDPRPMIAVLMGSKSIPYTGGTGGAGGLFDFSAISSGIANFGEHIAIFVIAVVLIIVGFFLVAEKQVTGIGKQAAKLAVLA